MRSSRRRGLPRAASAVALACVFLGPAANASPPDSAGAGGPPLSAGAGGPPLSAGAGARATLEQIHHWNTVGRCGEAERAARALLAEAERIHGPESMEVAQVLDELAVALRRQWKIEGPELLQVCERAVRLKERAFGRQDPRFATSLHNLGMAYYFRKDYVRARTLLEETLRIREDAPGDNRAGIAKTLLALGAIHHDLGDLEKARPLMERAVAIEDSTLGPSNPERAMGLNALAGLRYAGGDFSGSIPLFEQAISLWERSPTPNQGEIGTCYHNMGAVYDELGDHSRAVDMYQRAARIRKADRGGRSPLLATTLIGLGDAYRGAGKLARARDVLRRAVRILTAADPADPEDLGWALTKLGWVYLDEGHLAAADEAFQGGYRNGVEALGPDHPALWINLRGMAMVARRQGRTGEARGYYERAVDLVRRTSGPRHPDLGLTLAEYASFELAAGESSAAISTALLAGEVNRENVRLMAQGSSERQALIYTSDLDTGMDVALGALSGTPRARSAEDVRRVWDALVRSRALVLDEAAWRARVVEGAAGLLETATHLGSGRRGPLVERANQILEAARKLEAARGRLSNLLVRSPSGLDAELSRAQIPRARDEVDRCERALASRSAAFRTGHERASIGLDRVLSSLPPGSALVSIACHGQGRARSYVALVAGPDRSPRLVPLGSAGDIDRLIARWRNLAGRPPRGGPRELERAEAACRSEGRALRARVWDPFAPLLSGARMALVVPDGAFHLLNLAALPAANAGYLAESPLVIHYLSAERDLASMEAVRSHGVGLLAVGSADFDRPERRAPSAAGTSAPTTPVQPSGGDDRAPTAAYRAAPADCGDFRAVRFPPLPETGREVDEIGALWGRPSEVVVLKGRSAGEQSVKELLPGKRAAHIATHGFFLDSRCVRNGGTGDDGSRGIGGISAAGGRPPGPRSTASPLLVSGLALAGANLRASARPGEEDGILTAEEIVSLDLSGVDWVVLSACDTGLGDVQAGEGVLGLRRAFEAAGAGTLIMSLWGVEDRSARDWMRGLYEGRLRRSLESAQAVHEADIGALESLRAQGRSTHPFYWAAFVAVGDWR